MFDWSRTIVRFYEPALAKKRLFIKGILQSTLFSLFDVFTILVFKRMAEYAEQQDLVALSSVAWIFVVVVIIYVIIKTAIRHR